MTECGMDYQEIECEKVQLYSRAIIALKGDKIVAYGFGITGVLNCGVVTDGDYRSIKKILAEARERRRVAGA